MSIEAFNTVTAGLCVFCTVWHLSKPDLWRAAFNTAAGSTR